MHTLLQSDSDTDENEHAYGSASQGLWINPKAAKEMQNLLDRVVLQFSGSRRCNNDGNSQRSASTANPIIDVDSSNNNTNKTNSNENDQNESPKSSIADEDAFQTLLKEAFQTIIQSDIRRGEFSGNSDGSSSQGRWLYDPAARKLQAVMDRLVIHVSFDAAAADIGVADSCCNQETLFFQFC
eukprot:scaffold5161_cov94-Skeletonema_dohrnii-CCMP3373.AAC.2